MTNTIRPDFVLENPRNHRRIIVEVKARPNLTEEVAQSFRQGMLEHGLLEGAAYFLLVSAETGYLWVTTTRAMESPPALVFPMHAVIARYWPDPVSRSELSGMALEIVIQQWLYDLTAIDQRPDYEPERSFYDLGLIKGLCGSSVLAEAVA